MQSLFAYPGSKWHLMPHLVRLFPKHEHYVTAFGGSGTDILRKKRSKIETFSDLDQDIINCFRVLRDVDRRQALVERLEYTEYSRQVFEEALQSLDSIDPVTRAWAWLVACIQGHANKSPRRAHASNWSYDVGTQRQRRRIRELRDGLHSVVVRFRDVQLFEKDWRWILNKFNGDGVFFFLDPPYLLSTRSDRCYRHEMTDEDHEELLERLLSLRGKAMLFGHESPMYMDALRGWQVYRTTEKERVWLNY